MKSILTKLHRAFAESFPGRPLIVRSPGRINIIGEHTDYNEGFVLPAAIDKAAYMALSLRDDDEIHIKAIDFHESFSVQAGDVQPVTGKSWPNYILGSAAQFTKRGVPLRGFNAVLTSDVPMGAGMSSSAAVECATVFSLNEVLHTHLDKLTMVHMAQKAEHEYAGVLCGIMDQFASIMGKKDHVIKLDCRTLAYEYVPFALHGVKIVLFNTNVKHALASSAYNTRRKECGQAVAWVQAAVPEVHSLRDVTEEMLDRYVLPQDKLIDRRSRYVVQEIQRLLTACEDLRHGDLRALGKKMMETHEGLKTMYGVSCRELDWLVDQVKENEAVLGERMMGGGFGGCTINLVEEASVEHVVAALTPAYEKAMHLPLTHYIASIENGTEVIE
jgi:galactokinase